MTSRVSGRTADVLSSAFYLGVAAVALAGQTTAAVSWLHWPIVTALPAVALLEVGGIALAARADFRRRLGEQAIPARLLSGAVAVFAVVFNWLGHASHLQGGFFAGMSALGYAVWLINSGDRRRDQLRAAGKLPPTPPAYGWWRWLRHPARTARARALALAEGLDLYGSLTAVRTAELAEREAARQRRRQAAIAEVLRRKIAASADKTTAEIAVTVFDLDEIAARLAANADYDGLTGLIAADLDPVRLLAAEPTSAMPDTPAAPVAVPLSAHVPAVLVSGVRRALTATAAAGGADSRPDTRADSPADISPDSGADKPAPRKRTGARTSGRTPKTDTATAVKRMRDRHPEWQVADIARRLGVTDRTVRRHLNGSTPTT